MPNMTDVLKSTLTAIRDRAALLEREARAERLESERAIRQLARGTGSFAPQARAAVESVQAEDLAAKLERVLRGPLAPLTVPQLASAVGAPAARVLALLKRFRATKCPTRSLDDASDARQIYNVGEPEDPRWIWVVGDGDAPAETEELGNMVRKLLTLKAMTFAELTLATGARRGRLSGRIVQLQREGENIGNVGDDPRVYVWKLTPTRRVLPRRAR